MYRQACLHDISRDKLFLPLPPPKKKLKKIKVSFSKLSLYHTTLGSKELKTAVFPELIF